MINDSAVRIVKRKLDAISCLYEEFEDHLEIETPCIFPDGDIITFYLYRTDDCTFTLTDIGDLLAWAFSYAVECDTYDKIASKYADKYGVLYEDGELYCITTAMGIIKALFELAATATMTAIELSRN